MTQSSRTERNSYDLQRASWRDLRAVHRLERQAFTTDAYNYFDLFLLCFWPGMVALKMADAAGQLVGFVAGGQLLGQGRTWIMTIGVHPEHQGRGLGQRLLLACEAQLTDPQIYLTVRVSNERAIYLYRKNGYRQVRIKDRYYKNGESGIEMRKERAL
ncbi:GNAT family N-acetyltransferase [Chloroflexota bacterium]